MVSNSLVAKMLRKGKAVFGRRQCASCGGKKNTSLVKKVDAETAGFAFMPMEKPAVFKACPLANAVCDVHTYLSRVHHLFPFTIYCEPCGLVSSSALHVNGMLHVDLQARKIENLKFSYLKFESHGRFEK
jgi:hypothetical protein